MNRRLKLIALGSLLALPAAVSAHEFWIEPRTFHLTPGASLPIALRVGDGLPGEPYVRNPKHIRQFVAVGPSSLNVDGTPGSDPAGAVRLTQPGYYVIGYRSNQSKIELAAEKFESYLKEEGLDHVIALRKARGDSSKPGRETYSRCAKSIVCVGDAAMSGHDRALGFDLELICESAPAAIRRGESIALRLLYKDKPLPGARVSAACRNSTGPAQTARTDADGRVTFTVDTDGMWLFATTHMFDAPAGADADWESLWASLTLEARAT
ncbi:MAG: hypothetical protein CHACPFDD_03655 [Phycisphaerae bacterium]|nr:hypothetical protein [Phycisphaerae bacterium]